RMEPHDDVEQGRYAPFCRDGPSGRLSDAGDQLQKRRLPGTVVPYQARCSSSRNLEGHVGNGVEAVLSPPCRKCAFHEPVKGWRGHLANTRATDTNSIGLG